MGGGVPIHCDTVTAALVPSTRFGTRFLVASRVLEFHLGFDIVVGENDSPISKITHSHSVEP